MASAIRAMGPARLGFALAAWLFLVCLVVQVVLVGLEIFAEVGGSLHRDFAYVYGWLTPILVLLGGLARVSARLRWLTVVLLVLFAVQTVLPSLAEQLPLVGAFHTVIALAMFWLAVVVARRATGLIRPGRTIDDA
jgi:hypothetical protein